MEVDLTDDQEFFRSTTRKFLEAECPLATVRALEDDADGFSPTYWKRGAELGWTSMLVPEEQGGGSLTGEGLLDLVLVAEEMGRLVSPGPLLPTSVVADAIASAGSAEQRDAVLPGIVAGEVIAAWAFAEPRARWRAEGVALTATRAGDGYVLAGRKTPVEAAAQAHQLLVTARTDEGLTQFLVPADAPGVTITPLKSLDLVKRFATVDFDDAAVPASAVVGTVGAAEGDVERQLQVAIALQCAETCGALERVLEFTLEYLNDRYSFGRPLSSYQALKHRIADLKTWLEASLGTATAAAEAVQRGDDEAADVVSVAKAYIGDRATELVQDCVQLHGGIGVTWEHDLHLYLRRVTTNRAMYGSPADHHDRLAAALGL